MFTVGIFLVSLPVHDLKKNAIRANTILCFYGFALFVFVFIGCRGLIGTDWLNYYPFFQKAPSFVSDIDEIKNFVSHSYFEKGYAIYTVLCKTVSSNYFVFQLISFLLDFLVLHSFFRRYAKRYYFLAWAFYFIFQGYIIELIILRNAKSIMCFLISIQYIHKKQWLKYYAMNFIGILFHISAIFYLPIYFLCRLKLSKRLELIVFIIGNIVYLLQIEWLKTILLRIVTIWDNHYSGLIERYINSDLYSVSYGITIGYVERTITFILFYFNYKKLIMHDKNMDVFWYLFLIYIYVYLFCSEFFIILERIPNLFVCSYWILYPNFFRVLKHGAKYLFIVMIILYGVLKMLSLFNLPWASYENVLFDTIDVVWRKQFVLT
jgi:hypothetical protein